MDTPPATPRKFPQQFTQHASCGVGVLVDLNRRKTHQLVDQGLLILENLDHRGARGDEENTGDGAGILLQKPHDFFKSEIPQLGTFDTYGVGQAFLPRNRAQRRAVTQLIEQAVRDEGLELVAWRTVPTEHSGLGAAARQWEPLVMQFFIQGTQSLEPVQLDARLYVLRRVIEKAVCEANVCDRQWFYICSLDRRKIVYKGLLTGMQLKHYYPELSDLKVMTGLVLVHSRFSTNTLGAWNLAHPYRCIVHNGEINTLRGNLNAMKTREPDIASSQFGEDIDKLKPVTSEGLSDTAVFDNVLELILEAGRSLPHALRMLIPEAWHRDSHMSSRRRAFYDYHSTIMEPWDGPALVVATDGYNVGAVLDRNGLRPCRYWITKDRRLIMGSESGVLDIPADQIVLKGRLRPGQLLLADTRQGRIIPEDEIFEDLTRRPYGEWLRRHRLRLTDLVDTDRPMAYLAGFSSADVATLQRAFGYTAEQLRCLVRPMAEEGKDPLGSMGSDTPPAVLSARCKPLSSYFQQLFAQVSNPPIDYLRERLVTSLEGHVGKHSNFLDETPQHCRQLWLQSPILTGPQYDALLQLDQHGMRAAVVGITYRQDQSLTAAIEQIRVRALEAIEEGSEILILSDRMVGRSRMAVPSLLAVGAVHHHLIRRGLRRRVGLILDTGQPCTVHQFCTLLGYGAEAIHPWLAYQSVMHLARQAPSKCDPDVALQRYRKAIEDGILKVMSKMGISTVDSYKGAQVFEAIGLDLDFVREYFEGTTAHIPGAGIEQFERELRDLHAIAFGDEIPGNPPLDQGGEFYWRRDGEHHQWNPFTIGKLQHAVRIGGTEAYGSFANYINEQEERLQTFRGLLDFEIDPAKCVPIEEVESWEQIARRFATASMSFGSLSREAHETLAVAMNRIGGISGTGEGGEQVDRFGTERECSMKQVASGRFGVTIDYLRHARQIEIKMAQGAKPGEGGELPGAKVDEGIATVRFTVPGVGLISPPPHHDIYSIEDLAQLIHDLKCANPDAEIHVKLVAVGGVGTIAAGVAKARADAVLISGDSGGTGASVKTSIKSAGSPWELGLAESHQVLLANNLRSRIRLRADGGLKTGRDVVIAALLGAEEFSFGTAPLVALGCLMLRKCHCNTCSVGIATQNPTLRQNFQGKPEYVINYMRFVALEVRELMAVLGFRSVSEMIGRVDKLRQKAIKHPKGVSLDLSQLLYTPASEDVPRKTRQQNHGLDKQIDHQIIDQALPAIDQGRPVHLSMPIRNHDRSVGALLSSVVTKRYGAQSLAPDTVRTDFKGSAGQSFAAFLARGITFHLDGDANDYVGKGLSGGKVAIRAPPDAAFVAAENIIVGNVVLYGATAGEVYFNGIAGERFAVRNSGALAVVEGVGDHGCEYMTGGAVLILGSTGKNFGAGMSGGEAYVYDEESAFAARLNSDMVHIEPLSSNRDLQMVYRMLENHAAYTGSAKAVGILTNWNDAVQSFVKVIPDTYADIVARSLRHGRDIRVPLPPRPGSPAASDIRVQYCYE